MRYRDRHFDKNGGDRGSENDADAVHCRNSDPAGRDEWRSVSLAALRKIHIQRVLAVCRGNGLRAAQVLGIGRTSLYRYLKRDEENTRIKAKSGGAAA